MSGRDLELDQRLSRTYGAAMRQQHFGARVEIHLGSDVVRYLQSMANKKVPDVIGNSRTLWGFPVADTTASPDHISVHTVESIA